MACCAGGAVVEPCAVGHYSDIYTDPVRPSCNICPPGTADDDRNPATPCTLCPVDTYSGEGATSCTVCPQGSSAQYSGKRVLPLSWRHAPATFMPSRAYGTAGSSTCVPDEESGCGRGTPSAVDLPNWEDIEGDSSFYRLHSLLVLLSS